MFGSTLISFLPLATVGDTVFGIFAIIVIGIVSLCAGCTWAEKNPDATLLSMIMGCIGMAIIVIVANCAGWFGWLSQPSYMPNWTWYVANQSDSTNVQPTQPPALPPQPEQLTAPPSPPKPKSGNPEQLKADLDAKIKELESKKAAYEKVIGDTEKEKGDIVENLKKLGVKSSADLKGKPKAQRYAERLTQVVHELTLVQKRRDECEEAIDTGKFKLRSFERLLTLRRAGISDDELADVSTIIAKLDEKLKSGADGAAQNPLKIEVVVDKELKQP